MEECEAAVGVGRTDGPDPPLHVLCEDKYVELVLERLTEDVGQPVFMSYKK